MDMSNNITANTQTTPVAAQQMDTLLRLAEDMGIKLPRISITMSRATLDDVIVQGDAKLRDTTPLKEVSPTFYGIPVDVDQEVPFGVIGILEEGKLAKIQARAGASKSPEFVEWVMKMVYTRRYSDSFAQEYNHLVTTIRHGVDSAQE